MLQCLGANGAVLGTQLGEMGGQVLVGRQDRRSGGKQKQEQPGSFATDSGQELSRHHAANQ